MENRFGSRGLYLLDEPESALSPMRLMSLICLIHRLAEDGHIYYFQPFPILMAIPVLKFLSCQKMEFNSPLIRKPNISVLPGNF